MRIVRLQKLIDILRFKRMRYFKSIRHRKYGKLYLPNYSYSGDMSSNEYDIYSKDGRKLRTFFLRDTLFSNTPATSTKYFIFDRYNYGLQHHFYTHQSILETVGKPLKKYAMLIESESIVPDDYKIFDKHKGLDKDFDLIFTYSARLLDKYDNARFVPFCARVFNADTIRKNSYKNKTKNISILSSNKLMCKLHKYRYNLAFKCKKEGLADTFGTFDGGVIVDINSTLNDYRYSICIENDITPYFFTERLINALACGCIPIYYGATQIDKFFNMDGIITFNQKDDIEKVLKQCTKEEYERRLPAIIDNINRAKEYFSELDFMVEKYLSDICDCSNLSRHLRDSELSSSLQEI